MKKQLVLIAVIAGLAVAGCSSRAKRSSSGAADESSAETEAYSESAPAASVPTVTVGDSTGSAATAGSAAASAASANVVYFEFDSATLTPEGLVVVDQWAKLLATNPSSKVRLEGHADERGTREYNIGLGERRANSVQDALAARGVGPKQLAIISFGEERPVALGHDEGAWTQNRRVEISD